MMKTTITLATNLHISPFELFQQDCDEVIMLINFYILMSKDKTVAGKTKPQINKPQNDKNKRIRVNDMTATGGWF